MVCLTKKICGIITSETGSAEEAEELSAIMKNCPYLVVSGTAQNRIYSIYIVPENKRWWLKYPETNPKATGVEKASTHIIENLLWPEDFPLRLPARKTETAPCGAKCQECTLRQEYSCTGCPATTLYKDAT